MGHPETVDASITGQVLVSKGRGWRQEAGSSSLFTGTTNPKYKQQAPWRVIRSLFAVSVLFLILRFADLVSTLPFLDFAGSGCCSKLRGEGGQ